MSIVRKKRFLAYTMVIAVLLIVMGSVVEAADAQDFTITVDDQVVVQYPVAELQSKLGEPQTAIINGETLQGLFVDVFMERLGMVQRSSEVAILSADGITSMKRLTQYSSDGDFIAWQAGVNPIRDVVGSTEYYLRLYDADGKMHKGVLGIIARPVYNWTVYPEAVGVRNIDADIDGGVWIATTTGLFYLDDKGNLSRKYEDLLDTQWIYDVAVDNEGNLWVTQGYAYQQPGDEQNNKGFIKFSPAGEKLAQYTYESTAGKLPNNFVQAIEVDSNGNIWLGHFPGENDEGLTRFNPNTNEWKSWSMADGMISNSVNTLVVDKTGGIWVGYYPYTNLIEGQFDGFSGGYTYIDSNDELLTWLYDADDEELNDLYFGDFWTRGIAVDSKNNAWITRAAGGGIGAFYDPATGNLPLEACVGGRLDFVTFGASENSSSFSADDRENIVDHYTGRAIADEIDASIYAERYEDTGMVISGMATEIRALAADGNDDLWLGTSGIGLILQTRIGSTAAHYSSKTFDWPFAHGQNDDVRILYIDEKGTVYMGASGGLMVKNFPEITDKTASNPPEKVSAERMTSRVLVDGDMILFEAYLINGNNYFKLRDLAFTLMDSVKKFEVEWIGEDYSVNLIPGSVYTPVGGEMSNSADGAITVKPGTHKLYIQEMPMLATAYEINGNNYFRLQDIGRLLDFRVTWRSDTQMIEILSSMPY